MTRTTWAACLALVVVAPLAMAGQDGGAKPGPNAASSPAGAAQAQPAAPAPETTGGTEANAATQETTPEVEPPGPKPVPEDLPDPARLVVIDLHEEVSLGMASFVERVVSELEPGDVLVLDINTFGGRVDAAVRIRDALLALGQRKIPTVAYVHPRAISAGALISLATDIIIVAPGATMGAATPIRVGGGGEAEPVEEKTVSYMRKEMRATAEARGRNGDLAEAMVDADVVVPGLVTAGKLLTLDGKQALAWGVASAEAQTLDDLAQAIGYGQGGKSYTVHRVSWSWAEKVAAFLTSSILSGLLMSIGMLGLMIGLYTGGNPLPLSVGAVCLVLFFFGHHIVDLAGIEEVVLFVLGVGLILFEAFAPGHILPGVFGIMLVIASLLMGLVSFDDVPFTVQWHQGWILRALATVFGAVAGAAVLAIFAFQVLPGTGFGRKLLLETAIEARATDAADKHHHDLVGQIGVAVSDLRPSGKVSIGSRRFDAVAERGFVPAGAQVKVRKTRGFSIVVVEIKKEIKKHDTSDHQESA